MHDDEDSSLRSEEEAQALLNVFTLQPPADFAEQVFARIRARQAASESSLVPPVPPDSYSATPPDFGRAS